MGTQNELLRLLTSSNGVETAANGVRTFVPGWRRGWDGFESPWGDSHRCAAPFGRRKRCRVFLEPGGFSPSPHPPKTKPLTGLHFWRRGWDSNPRRATNPCWFSRPVHSTALPPLRCGLCVAHCACRAWRIQLRRRVRSPGAAGRRRQSAETVVRSVCGSTTKCYMTSCILNNLLFLLKIILIRLTMLTAPLRIPLEAFAACPISSVSPAGRCLSTVHVRAAPVAYP